ncbi:MAG: hypothetical protein IPF87_04760 [Gemmatimonadetes bacterium]|jgi:hypothetical protein|nr:hypothetical protein [Gemmatimonadota bacterium]MBK7835248.1 hypothetical protein [Gemmatimonadota bacterium]
MPRIRTIKPEFFSDEKLAPLPVLTRFVFLGLISMADDCGRVLDNLKIIDAYIFPETSETSRGSLTDLSAMGRIQRGVTASGQRIIQIVNWTAHQKIEKPNFRSALPPIDPQDVAAPSVDDGSPSLPRLVGETSGRSRGNVGEESPNHTNDQRPSTDDLRPPTNDHARRAAAGGGNLGLKGESQGGNALPLTVAANQAIAARYGEQADPIISSHAGSFAAAKSLDEAGVPLEFATAALAEIVQTLGLEEPPRSLKYFVAPIIRRWEASEAHAQARSSPSRTATAPREAGVMQVPPRPELALLAQHIASAERVHAPELPVAS